jgi:parvin
VFDKLFDEAPEKLEPVKRVRPDTPPFLVPNISFPFPMSQSLCQFCSKVLEELEIVINDLETQFQSGVNMVLMMGLLEGYYIPHYLWHYTPKNFEERVRQCV